MVVAGRRVVGPKQSRSRGTEQLYDRCKMYKLIWIYGHLQMSIPSLVHVTVYVHICSRHLYKLTYTCMFHYMWSMHIQLHMHACMITLHCSTSHCVALHCIRLNTYIQNIDIYVYINILNISTKGVAPRSTELTHWRDAVRRPCISRVSWCRWCRGTGPLRWSHCFVPSFSGENCSFRPDNSSF